MKIDEVVAKLKMKTVENGCTAAEAEAAKRKIQQLQNQPVDEEINDFDSWWHKVSTMQPCYDFKSAKKLVVTKVFNGEEQQFFFAKDQRGQSVFCHRANGVQLIYRGMQIGSSYIPEYEEERWNSLLQFNLGKGD